VEKEQPKRVTEREKVYERVKVPERDDEVRGRE